MALGKTGAGRLKQGRHDIDMGGDAIVARAGFNLGGPSKEEGGADAAIMDLVLLATGIDDVALRVGSIVYHEDDDRVFSDLTTVEMP